MQRITRHRDRKIRTKAEGVDFVSCLICGRHLCVISDRHLSTHGTDRQTYIEEYRLSPDRLCSKSFRVNHSCRPDYRAHSRREWIAAIKAMYKQHGNVYAGFLQKHYPNLYLEGIWLCGDWDSALRVLGFTPKRMRLRSSRDTNYIGKFYRHSARREAPPSDIMEALKRSMERVLAKKRATTATAAKKKRVP